MSEEITKEEEPQVALPTTKDVEIDVTINGTRYNGPIGNILEVSDENASNGVYVLANGSQGVGFYKWAGGSLGAGRAIVPAYRVNSTAREFLGFDFSNEATAIKSVKTKKAENQYFNLTGQQITHPVKGLYIANGKKVVFK